MVDELQPRLDLGLDDLVGPRLRSTATSFRAVARVMISSSGLIACPCRIVARAAIRSVTVTTSTLARSIPARRSSASVPASP